MNLEEIFELKAIEEEFWSKSVFRQAGIDHWVVKADEPLIKEQASDEVPEVPLPTLPV